MLKSHKERIWDKCGDYSLSPELRESYIKEYIYLSHPTMDINDFFKLSEYKQEVVMCIGESQRLKNQRGVGIGDIAFVIRKKHDDQIELSQYRLI